MTCSTKMLVRTDDMFNGTDDVLNGKTLEKFPSANFSEQTRFLAKVPRSRYLEHLDRRDFRIPNFGHDRANTQSRTRSLLRARSDEASAVRNRVTGSARQASTRRREVNHARTRARAAMPLAGRRGARALRSSALRCSLRCC